MDRYRPRYHFTPLRNWMNDPNAPLQWQGEYHLFYQHNPNGPAWGDIHWGHAKSTDLVNWERLPVALAPSRELGELHCYSGCSVVDGEEVKVFYTSIGEGERNATDGAQQWSATGGGDLLAWDKQADRPVLTGEAHGDFRVTEWRDPYVWRESGEWHMLTGGIHEDRGCGLLYRSADLEQWRFEGLFHQGDESIWECPHIYRFGDKAVLCYSPSGPVRYVSGTMTPTGLSGAVVRGTVDYGGWEGFYASTGFVDERGRRIMLGWMPEGRGERFPVPLEWTGALAIPRIVGLKDNGALSMTPIPELAALRGERRSYADVRVGREPMDTGVRSSSFECALEVRLPDAGEEAGEHGKAGGEYGEFAEFVVSVLVSPCGRERTEVRLNFKDRTVAIDRSRSSLFPGVHKTSVVGEFKPDDEAAELRLRLFVDQSTIEVFVGDETCLSARVYPSLDDSTGIELRSDADIDVIGMDIWEMNAAEFR